MSLLNVQQYSSMVTTNHSASSLIGIFDGDSDKPLEKVLSFDTVTKEAVIYKTDENGKMVVNAAGDGYDCEIKILPNAIIKFKI